MPTFSFGSSFSLSLKPLTICPFLSYTLSLPWSSTLSLLFSSSSSLFILFTHLFLIALPSLFCLPFLVCLTLPPLIILHSLPCPSLPLPSTHSSPFLGPFARVSPNYTSVNWTICGLIGKVGWLPLPAREGQVAGRLDGWLALSIGWVGGWRERKCWRQGRVMKSWAL